MKKYLKFILPVLLLLLIYFLYINYPKLNIITGFAAKNACSCIFEAGRDLQSVEAGDNNFAPVSYATKEVNIGERSVTSTIIGLKERTAVFKIGLGCTLLPEDIQEEEFAIPKPNRQFLQKSLPYPYGFEQPKDSIFPNIDYQKLEQAVENGFDPEGQDIKRTRAVVILYKDHLIAEKYASGINRETKLLGWSMTKSITSAILGVLEKQGKITLSQDNLFEAWSEDDRAGITLNNLLHMNSGLEWEEDYSKISDVTKMLFLEENMALEQLNKPLVGRPGETWNLFFGNIKFIISFYQKPI